jgi:hypothetical protein
MIFTDRFPKTAAVEKSDKQCIVPVVFYGKLSYFKAVP